MGEVGERVRGNGGRVGRVLAALLDTLTDAGVKGGEGLAEMEGGGSWAREGAGLVGRADEGSMEREGGV